MFSTQSTINHKKAFLDGMRDGLPIGLGYFAVAFSLCIVCTNAGVTPFQGFLASLFTVSSTGEYAAFTIMASHAAYFEVALIALIANARYLLMGCALSQRIPSNVSIWKRLLLGFGVTDELFGITIAREGLFDPCYTYGGMLTAIPLWALGTSVGIAAGNLVSPKLASALSVAIYGMFLAIIIPPSKKNKIIGLFVLISFAASYLAGILPGISAISGGTRVIILTVVISAVAAIAFPVNDEEESHE